MKMRQRMGLLSGAIALLASGCALHLPASNALGGCAGGECGSRPHYAIARDSCCDYPVTYRVVPGANDDRRVDYVFQPTARTVRDAYGVWSATESSR